MWIGAAAAQGGLPEGWRFAWPLPQGNALYAAWAAGPEDLFVGGEGGALLRWNGERWTAFRLSTHKTIFGIHGLGPDDVWAVGGDTYAADEADRALILHYDGQKWTEMPAPDFLGTTYPLNGVCALAPDDVWATVYGSTSVIHYDGRSWDWVFIPLALEGELLGVGAVGPDHLFFFGSHGQIVHKDGDQWRLEQKLEEGNFSWTLLQSIWAPDLAHVYIGDNHGGLYHREENGTWTHYATTSGSLFEDGSSYCIWGGPDGAIYIVGASVIRRFQNGSTETLDYEGRIRGYWYGGTPAGDRLYAVGALGVVHEFVPDGQGGRFSPLTAGGGQKIQCEIHGAVPLGDERAALVYGSSVYIAEGWPLYIVSPEGAYRFPKLPEGMDTYRARIIGAYARGPRDILVAWENQFSTPPELDWWNGKAWIPVPADGLVRPPTQAFAFWESPSGVLYACEDTRILKSEDREQWTLLRDQFEANPDIPYADVPRLTAFWGRSDNEIYAATAAPAILRFDGADWRTESLSQPEAVRAICGDAENVYAVGVNGAVWRRMAGAWERIPGTDAREGNDFTALVAASAGVLAVQVTPSQYTGGGLARVWRLDGDRAELLAAGLSARPAAATALSDGSFFLLGQESWGRRNCLVTDAPPPEGMNVFRFAPDGEGWVPLGDSGLSAYAPADLTARPVLAVWRAAAPVPVFSDLFPEAISPAAFVIRQEISEGGTSTLPPMRLRIGPPAGPFGSNPTLFTYSVGEEWLLSPLSGAPIPEIYETAEAVSLVSCVAAGVPETESPSLQIALLPDGAARLSWSAPADSWQIEWTEAIDSDAWQPLQGVSPIYEEGQWRVQVAPAGKTAFYRLRRK